MISIPRVRRLLEQEGGHRAEQEGGRDFQRADLSQKASVRKWLTTAIELPTHSATVAMKAPPI